MCMWVHRRDAVPLTPAMVAFIADMVPLSVAHGAGVVAGGTSSDNAGPAPRRPRRANGC